MTRLAFYGPRGSGKSTAASYLSELLPNCEVIPSAQPLYDLQSHAYQLAGIDLPLGHQDAGTLAAMAAVLRRLDPDVLAKYVVSRVKEGEKIGGHPKLILCPDSRPLDRPLLQANGFRFAHFETDPHVRASRRRARGDIGEIDDLGDPDEYFEGDYRVVNNGSIADLRSQILRLSESL